MKSKAIESNDSLFLDELNKIGTPDPKNADQFFHFTRKRRKYLDAADTSWFGTLKKEAEKFTKQELNKKHPTRLSRRLRNSFHIINATFPTPF